MQFMQNGRKVFKEVLPMVAEHIAGHMADEGVEAADLKRLWLHQANKSMNDFIGRKVLGRAPEAGARIWSTRNGLNATGSRARRPPEAGASERLVRV